MKKCQSHCQNGFIFWNDFILQLRDELIKAFAESKLLLYEYGALDSVDHPDFQTEFYVMTSGLSWLWDEISFAAAGKSLSWLQSCQIISRVTDFDEGGIWIYRI